MNTINVWVRILLATVLLLAGSSRATDLYFVHTDHLGTPRLIANGAGQPVWQWANDDPFGNNAPNENPSGLGTFTCDLRFPGQYFDKETNSHYNYFRDYDPWIGRYIQSDPIGLAGGVNMYVYANAHPVVRADPLGLWSISFGGFAGPGWEISFGKDPNTAQGFMSFRFGFGAGGGFKWDPMGGRPGSTTTERCDVGGVGAGVFGDVEFNAGPLQAGLQNGFGRNYPYGNRSVPYGQFMDPSFTFGSSWGINATGAFGGQITIWTRR